MKIAYVIHGLVGGLTGKNYLKGDDDFTPILIEYIYNNINQNILQFNKDVDFYIFNWQPEYGDIFKKFYKPKKSIFTNQIIFQIPKYLKNDARTQAHYSRWYGLKQIYSLINQEYDLIVNPRMDLLWNHSIDFSVLDTSKIHISSHPGEPESKHGLTDHLFIMNQFNMNKFSTMFDNLNTYVNPDECMRPYSHISHHWLSLYHLKKLGLYESLSRTYVNYLLDGIGRGNYNLLRYKNLSRTDVIKKLKYE